MALTLDPEELLWAETSDWATGKGTHPNGTANPTGLFFDALPDLVCATLAGDIRIGGETLSFLKARDGQNVSLVEWPPKVHTPVSEQRVARWSFRITPSVQTIPGRADPVVLLRVSISKWLPETGRTTVFTRDKNKSVLISVDDTWFSQGSEKRSRVAVQVVRDRNSHGEWEDVWEAPFDRMMDRLAISEDLKLDSPQSLIENPERYFDGDGISMGMLVTNRMDVRHPVKSGVPQRDWIAVVEAIERPLGNIGLRLGPQVERIDMNVVKTRSTLRLRGKEKKESKSRRTYSRLSLSQSNPEGVRFLILHQREDMRQALESQIREASALADDMNFSVVSEPLGDVGAELAEKSEREFQNRVREVAGRFGAVNATVALVELQGADDFKDKRDPKAAIRKGLAKAGILSQFIMPFKDNEDNTENKVESAVEDALRQLGHLTGTQIDDFNQGFLERGNIDTNMELIGLWVVRNSNRYGHRLPVFVRISPKDFPAASRVSLAQMTFPVERSSVNSWLTYPDGLRRLGKGNWEWLDQKKSEEFIGATLRGMGNANVLLTVGSGNARTVWNWLSDKNVVFDAPDAVTSSGLRIARVRGSDSDEDESPAWFATRDDNNPTVPTGLFDSGFKRIFYSLQDKPPPMIQLANPKVSKIERPTFAYARPALKEIALVSLQPEDGAKEWAVLVHNLRTMSPHYDYSTTLPYPLHLAKLSAEYI